MSEPKDLSEIMVADRYWLAKATAMVDGAVIEREEAASRLVTAVGWFWAVYSGVALSAAVLGEVESVISGVALGVPALFLIIAYIIASWVLHPIDLSFDPRAPQQIEDAFAQVVSIRRGRLRIATTALVVAASTVAFTITGMVVLRGSESPAAHLTARLIQTDDRQEVLIQGNGSPDVPVLLEVASADSVVETLLVRASADGQFNAAIAADRSRDLVARATWNDGPLRTQLETEAR